MSIHRSRCEKAPKDYFFNLHKHTERRTKRESITQVACEFPIFPCYFPEKCGESGAQYWKEMEMRQAQLEWKSSERFMLSFSHPYPPIPPDKINSSLPGATQILQKIREMGIFNWKLFSSIIKIFNKGFYVTCMNGTLYFPQKSMNFTFSIWLSK